MAFGARTRIKHTIAAANGIAKLRNDRFSLHNATTIAGARMIATGRIRQAIPRSTPHDANAAVSFCPPLNSFSERNMAATNTNEKVISENSVSAYAICEREAVMMIAATAATRRLKYFLVPQYTIAIVAMPRATFMYFAASGSAPNIRYTIARKAGYPAG